MWILSPWFNAWLAFLCLICQTLLASHVPAGCAPYPISIRIGNVTLSNNSTARGLALSVGTPEQNFAFLPQWPLNNMMVYGTAGYCESRGRTRSQAGCTTFRGGQYDMIASNTWMISTAEALLAEGASYPQMSFFADTVKLNANVSLLAFSLGVALSSWATQDYHPLMAIGMGPNSTFLNALKNSGNIAARVFGIFWGRTGGRGTTEIDGSMVFGGYDKAKVVGPQYTQALLSDRNLCATGMLVTITDLVLNFLNGTNASLFPGTKTASISACIVPDYPTLMTLPLEPYFQKFRDHTNASISGRSMGVNFLSMRYGPGEIPYSGDLTIKLRSGLVVRVPNDQLVIPDTYSDAETGQWIANATEPNLIINSILPVNENETTLLGRQFLSAAYLLVNEETDQFTLWAANPTPNEDLIGFDADGRVADSICSGPTPSNGTGFFPSPTDNISVNYPVSSSGANDDNGTRAPPGPALFVSLICFAAVVAVGTPALYLYQKKTGRQASKNSHRAQDSYNIHELHDTSYKFPRELHSQSVGPQPDTHNEIAVSMPDESTKYRF